MGIGMLVDNSIVVIEDIYRLRSEGLSAPKAAVRGAKEMGGAIFASTLTTICVFLPIVFTEGLSREIFTDMGLTIAYSLLASLLVALTLVPALCSKSLAREKNKKQKWFESLRNAYMRGLRFSLRHKVVPLGLALLLLVVSVVGGLSMGTAFMPESDNMQIMGTIEMPEGSTRDELREMGDIVGERAAKIEGVETVGVIEGGNSMMSAGGTETSLSLYIVLSDERSLTSSEIAQKLMDSTADLPCTVEASSDNMMMSMGTSGITYDVRGETIEDVREAATAVAAAVASVEGTRNVSDGQEGTAPETHVVVDKEKAMAEGLTVAQVYTSVAAALTGETEATSVSFEEGDYPLIVAEDADTALVRDTLEDYVIRFSAMDGTSKSVRLGDIARIEEAEGLLSIQHQDGNRMLSVTAELDEGYNIGIVSREIAAKLDDVTLPEGCYIEESGENELINTMLRDLALMLLLAFVLIYAIMAAQFQSLKGPFIIMFTIPLAFTGGLLGLWICGFEISVIAMLGFLVLSGVVVNNGIVFIDTVNQLRREGVERTEALLAAGRNRLRPILMTAITTILSLSTLALAIGTGADMIQPMAIVVMFGLSYATLLTLFVIPALYDIMQKKPPRVVDLDGV